MRTTTGILAFAVSIVMAAASAEGQQVRKYAGRRVTDVLREVQSAQLRIMFSSDLVPPALIVKTEPTSATPRGIAEQILAPHGLMLAPGPRGRLLVVAVNREAPSPAPTTPPTEAADQPSQNTVPPTDHIRIEERVEVIDRLNDAGARPAVYNLEPITIQETAGGLEDVLRALQVLPGAAATNDRDGKLAVRGAGPEHNVIVVDGVQIHNPHRLGEFTSSFLNPSTTASVALDASGLDARHGGRLSSVTIIETRNGRTDRRLAGSGSVGLTSGDILLEGRLPNSTTGSWWATARGTYYSALMDRFGDAVPGFGDAQAKITLRPSRNTHLTAFGLVGRETARERGKEPDVAVPGGESSLGGSGAPELRPDPDWVVASGSRYKGWNRLGVATLSWTLAPAFATTTTLSAYAHTAGDYDGSLLIAGVPAFERAVRVSDFAARHRMVFTPSPGHVIDAGVETHRIASSWRMANVKQLDLFRGIGPSAGGELVDYSAGPVATDLTRTQAGVWLQYRLPLASASGIEPGARLDWNSFTREASWQPRLRISQRIGTTSLWVGIAVQAQTPSHESLQSFDYFHLTQADGARLRNERSQQVVAGVERPFAGGFTLRVEGFRRRFDRLLTHRLETDAERARRLAQYIVPPDLPADHAILEHRPTMEAESTGRGTAAGLEMLLKRQGRRMSGSLAYTFSKATRQMYGYTFPFDFDRPHALNAILGVQVTRRIRVAATWQRASGFPATAVREEVRFFRRVARDGTVDPVYRTSRLPDGRLAVSPNPAMRRLSLRNTERLNGYARADLRATYAVAQWEFYGEMLNVFNRWNHVQRIQYSSLGDGLGELVSESNAYAQFGRLPSFGIRVKF